MKIQFKEEKLAKGRVDLAVALVDVSPMMDPFKVLITSNKEGTLGIAVEKYGVADLSPGFPIATALVIHHGTYSMIEIVVVKSLFKNKLKLELQKYGYFDGLSEERIK